ncbi:uncharacterized protein LOC141528080 isoform X1 [Cotesia typhae]|uniref:uncharacterized protein LOC141528080 isoform X1 n=1 Tax=Cotesia typhae TaxID=2053667 RepID=UPI003D699AB3
MERMMTALKFKLPSAKNKQIIEEYINTTRIYRKSWILAENPSLSQIFDQYPRLDFNGEMISSDFENLFPKADDKFVTDFPSYYVPRILGYVQKYRPALFKMSKSIHDQNLRALLLLVELLPISNSIKGKGKG